MEYAVQPDITIFAYITRCGAIVGDRSALLHMQKESRTHMRHYVPFGNTTGQFPFLSNGTKLNCFKTAKTDLGPLGVDPFHI